ncbi:MAG: bacillithiol biosynthesis cysteine-adding enzyme BshC [Chloracidobacterium sp.]|nr:bacillithiol biosynthesis cysteine-adding enzyme BshC [Chloracidobacterium sp.]
MRASNLSFSAVPHQSKLFLDYIRDPLSLKSYYPNAVLSHSNISAFIPEVLAKYKTERIALCDALVEINSQIGSSEKTFENIKLLREADTVAVVTGQQAGLFTGPLYTIYKALSVIKMAEELNARGSKAVPVFWVATEDHDFDEVSHTYFTGNTGELVKADYHPTRYVKSTPVGNIKIDNLITETIGEALNDLPRSEFSGALRTSIEKEWSEGELFGKAFSKNIADVLGRFGLITIDPMHPGVKALSSPIYIDAIAKADEIVASIRKKSAALVSEGFHAQVLVDEDYFPLFRIDDEGRRVALRKTSDGVYTSKEEKREFSLSELAAIAKDDPQRFSAGVMLRPVVQDYLLPTVCYFGGAAEIAYFAQNSDAYNILDRPVTPILHRRSFTVVEAKHRRTLEKFGLALSDMFDGFVKTLENVGKKQLSSDTIKIFEEIEQTLDLELNRLDQNLSQIDPTLNDNLEKRRRKIAYHIAALKKKTYLASMRKDEIVERQIRAAFDSLLPNGELQERVLNVHSYLNKYGPYFIDMIYKEIDLNYKEHRVIDL